MNVNYCVFTGRLADEVQFEENIIEGRARAVGRLLINREGQKEEYDIIPFVAWDARAQVMKDYTSEGKELTIQGPMRTNSVKTTEDTWINYFELEVRTISLGRDSPKNASSVPKSKKDRTAGAIAAALKKKMKQAKQ
jgi:single-stranded DNA-binding protein